MIDDYDILTTRYSAVFENLDRELVQRIHMLMEPCFRFVESSRKEQLRNTDSSLSAMALVGHKEQLDVQARISAITVKQRAAGLRECQAISAWAKAIGQSYRTCVDWRM